MVCNNCGKAFPSDQINVITGGCNPIPLERNGLGRASSRSLADSLQAGRAVLPVSRRDARDRRH